MNVTPKVAIVERLNRSCFGRPARPPERASCFAFGHVVARPESLEQVKPEVFAYRFLDHFAVTFSGTGGANFDSPQHVCINRQCGPRPWHLGIIASNADYTELHRRLRQAETL